MRCYGELVSLQPLISDITWPARTGQAFTARLRPAATSRAALRDNTPTAWSHNSTRSATVSRWQNNLPSAGAEVRQELEKRRTGLRLYARTWQSEEGLHAHLRAFWTTHATATRALCGESYRCGALMSVNRVRLSPSSKPIGIVHSSTPVRRPEWAGRDCHIVSRAFKCSRIQSPNAIRSSLTFPPLMTVPASQVPGLDESQQSE